jgi:putative flippase GtrA
MNRIWQIIEKIVRHILKFLFHLAGKEPKEKTYQSFLQFVKFGLVGLSNTIISYMIYAGGLLLFKKFHWFGRVDYLVAQIAAFVISVAWSYFWNNRYVFKVGEGEKRSLWGSLLKTYISYSFTGLFLSSVLLIFWVRLLGLSEFIAPILNLIISVPLNFLINKFWAFRSTK